MDNRTPRINLLLEKVFVRKNLTCNSAVEVTYFSAKCFVNVCFHRLKIEEGSYPVCGRCAEKSENSKKVLKRKRNLTSEKNKEEAMNIVLRMTCMRNKTWDCEIYSFIL